jgi:succinyl-CoA synthetase beta subunit
MLLIEADGKALFAESGIAIPASRLAYTADCTDLPGPGPWVVKAQVPIGGRGKSGAIRRCVTPNEVESALRALLGTRLKGHKVDTCLIEQAVAGDEQYLAVMIDPASYGLRLIYRKTGGIDVEQTGETTGRLCAPQSAAIDTVVATTIPNPTIAATAGSLARLLLQHELMLAEINPLFVMPTGCIAGDAKLVVDLNAIHRQSRLALLIETRPETYADAHRKLREEFDYVELDPQGEIGLLTTGAGLSMMLVDELTARGGRPLNFCDIRTGQLRGSPVRIIRVLEWMTARPSLRVILVNIFAGITDLGEFANLLSDAVVQTPGLLRVPIIARLIGRNAEAARRILAERLPAIAVDEDLNGALAKVMAAAT